MTKRQRKNRKRINHLVELWPELFNREKPKPLKGKRKPTAVCSH